MINKSQISFSTTKYAFKDVEELCIDIDTTKDGLKQEKVDKKKEIYGSNEFSNHKINSIYKSIRRAFINPFNIILFILGLISILSDIFSLNELKQNLSTYIIFTMILISGFIRLIQELKARNAAKQLDKMIRDEILVKRDGNWIKLPAEKLVVGDLISFSAGDRIPADVRITKVNDLFISLSALTGESSILEMTSDKLSHSDNERVSNCTNLAFMATTVISGYGEGIIFATGSKTFYGNFIGKDKKAKEGLVKDANSIAWVLLKFMAILIPVIFILLGITKQKWFESFAFALSVAVGLVPEMLPMVITACLAKGSLTMSKKRTIVKDINAMQGFGSMDVICMDKTGTITDENILLEYYMDIFGNESKDALDLAYLNSSYHSGIKNPIDNAITLCKTMSNQETHFDILLNQHEKLDEIPFDHSRKYVSVLVKNDNNNLMITKGDIKKVIGCCKYVEYKNEIIKMDDDKLSSVKAIVGEMLEDGMKVIAVAKKQIKNNKISLKDENEMILVGYIAFFDAPKQTSKQSIDQLKKLNVKTKILTGDLALSTKSICRRVGISYDKIITGDQLNEMSDTLLAKTVEDVDVFVSLSPIQKVRIVSALRENGHCVGFLGDGINDIPVLNEADVGISVDSGVDAAKDCADVVLLEKNLTVLTDGILEGRKIFMNMKKYIKITASSNFGNIFSIVLASAFLPFLPMASVQLLLLNLLYDILCIVLPWDNVDKDETLNPKRWNGKSLTKFMLSFGPISSLFDVITFMFLYFYVCPSICDGLLFNEISDASLQLKYISIFQTGWFLESLWTQILVLHFLRTSKLPFKESRPSIMVIIITIIGIIIYTSITFIDKASIIGLTKMPLYYFVFLIVIFIFYMLLVTIIKYFYFKKHKELI